MSVSYVFEENKRTKFYSYYYFKPKCSKDKLKKCGTGGVMFHQSLILPDKFNLNFNTDFKLKAGEDSDFFYRAHRLGVKIVVSSSALVFEEVVPERLRIRFKLYDRYCAGASKWHFFRRYQKLKLFSFYLKVPFRFFSILEILIFPIYSVKGFEFIKYKLFKIGLRVAWALGFLFGFLNIKTNKYK